MFHFNSWEMMQGNTFDEHYFSQPESYSCKNNFQNLLESNMHCNNAEEFDICRFMNSQWHLDDIVREDYSPFMYPVDSFHDGSFTPSEPDFIDAILQGTSYDVDLLIENDIYPDMSKNCRHQTPPSISDVNVAVTADCLESKYDVVQMSPQYFDESYFFCEDDSDCWGTVATASNLPRNMPKSVSTGTVNHIQEMLEDKKLMFFLLATLLNEDDVLETLRGVVKGTYDGAARQLPQLRCSSCEFEKSCAKAEDYKPLKHSGSKRVHEDEKDEKYWKRRKENNAAVRRSREARKDRFAMMEKQIKELEVENAEKKEYLRTLKQKVLEQEKKFNEC